MTLTCKLLPFQRTFSRTILSLSNFANIREEKQKNEFLRIQTIQKQPNALISYSPFLLSKTGKAPSNPYRLKFKKPLKLPDLPEPKELFPEPNPENLAQCQDDDDQPIDAADKYENPYQVERRQCILCKYQITLDYKNPRLLAQFISSFSGRIYDKHITGLCTYQQHKLVETIKTSRRAGYMPVMIKDPRFLRDPKLFDPMQPQRPNPH